MPFPRTPCGPASRAAASFPAIAQRTQKENRPRPNFAVLPAQRARTVRNCNSTGCRGKNETGCGKGKAGKLFGWSEWFEHSPPRPEQAGFPKSRSGLTFDGDLPCGLWRIRPSLRKGSHHQSLGSDSHDLERSVLWSSFCTGGFRRHCLQPAPCGSSVIVSPSCRKRSNTTSRSSARMPLPLSDTAISKNSLSRRSER